MKLYSYRIPIDSPIGKMREGLILQSERGWGEIAPLPGFSGESFEEAKREILSVLRDGIAPALPSVRWGLACAKEPFPLTPIKIPLCALGPREDFPTVKIKLGHLPIHEAISLVKRLLPHHRLRLDCNRAWTLEQALEFARSFSPDDFEYLEEPVKFLTDLIRFSELTHFPIALDESIGTDWNEIPSLKAIVVKPTIVGSIPSVPPHLKLILSSSYETGIGLLHIARCQQSDHPIGLDTYRAFSSDLLATPIQCEKGYFSWTSASKNWINLDLLCPIAL